jgi:hypothetical protein
VHADLDTLCIALYVLVDDLFGPRLGPGRKPKLSDAELVCLAIAQVLLGFGSERRWLRFANRRLATCSPTCRPPRPTTGGCAAPHPWSPWPSKTSPRTPRAGMTSCAWSTPRQCPAPHPGRPSSVPTWPAMPATATARVTTASSGACGCMCWPPRTGCPSPGAWPPPSWASGRWSRRCWTTRHPAAPGTAHPGRQGFAGREFEALVADHGGRLLRPDRSDEPYRHGSLGRFRQWIESTFDTLNDQLGLERHGGRTLAGVYVRVAQRLVALAAAIWCNWQTGTPDKRSLVAYDH